jgi:succinyl-CoA synthetase beta subunit
VQRLERRTARELLDIEAAHKAEVVTQAHRHTGAVSIPIVKESSFNIFGASSRGDESPRGCSKRLARNGHQSPDRVRLTERVD